MLQISLYNPANISEKDLVDNFVIRKEEFNSIFKDILADDMKSPPQHYLIQAQRGNGKTTLLLRLYYEVKRNEKLNKWLIPIIFNEEEYGVSTIYRLWEKIAEYLEDEEELEEFEGIYDEMDKKSSSKNYEEECYLILKRYLESSGKKLVIFIDNFGDILSKLSEQEERRFREVLMTDSNMRIVGASSVVLENTYRYDKPFFEFFKIRNLSGLNTEEMIEFLLQLGESCKCKEKIENIINNDFARIESLRILTDGVPRTVALLFEIFIDDESGNSFKNLESLLDRVTPLYKHRMDDLPTKQQEIVDIVALNWDAIGAKEIAGKIRGESKSVSAQLQQLEKNKIIEKKSVGKNNLYQIKERFFNIWYLMRYGRKKERNRVRWLVQFFELWYDKNDFKERIIKHNESLKNNKIDSSTAVLMTEAMYYTNHDDLEIERLKEEMLKLGEMCVDEEGKKYLKRMSESKNKLNKEDRLKLMEGIKCFENKNYKNALKSVLLVKHKNNQVHNFLGVLYFLQNDLEKSKEYFSYAIKEGNREAYNNMGNVYMNQEKLAEAEDCYRKAIEEETRGVYNNLGNVYVKQGKLEEAEDCYRKAIEEETRGVYNNLGNVYVKQGKLEEAEDCYKKAIKEETKGVYNNLGNVYIKQGKLEEAEDCYKKATEEGDENSYFNLGNLYMNQGKFEEAEDCYRKAIEEGDENSYFNLGNLYMNQGKFEEAKECYIQAIANGDTGAYSNLGNLYMNQGKFEESEECYKKVIEEGKKEAYNSLAWLYYKNKQKREEALDLIRKAVSSIRNIYTTHTLAMILLWNDEIEEAIEISKEFMTNEESFEEFPQDIMDFLLMLMAKGQYNYLSKLFEENRFNLKDRYKPVYYALVYLKNDKDEYMRIGEELKETVEDIVNRINIMKIEYI